MRDGRERATCRGCGRPIFRYVVERVRKSPGDVVTTTTWWFHEHEQSFACDQVPAADG